jgi:hypothetical protein
MRYVVLLGCLCAVLPASLSGGEAPERWPTVRPETLRYVLSDPAQKSISHLIEDAAGKPAYLFQAYINAYDYAGPTSEHILSGDVECVLTPLYSRVDGINLLTNVEHPSRDWQNRGRFFLSEFDVPTKQQQEGWGRERRFSLRDMDLVIKIVAYKRYSAEPLPWWAIADRPRMLAVELAVNVAVNPRATNAIHLFPDYDNRKK